MLKKANEAVQSKSLKPVESPIKAVLGGLGGTETVRSEKVQSRVTPAAPSTSQFLLKKPLPQASAKMSPEQITERYNQIRSSVGYKTGLDSKGKEINFEKPLDPAARIDKKFVTANGQPRLPNTTFEVQKTSSDPLTIKAQALNQANKPVDSQNLGNKLPTSSVPMSSGRAGQGQQTEATKPNFTRTDYPSRSTALPNSANSAGKEIIPRPAMGSELNFQPREGKATSGVEPPRKETVYRHVQPAQARIVFKYLSQAEREKERNDAVEREMRARFEKGQAKCNRRLVEENPQVSLAIEQKRKQFYSSKAIQTRFQCVSRASVRFISSQAQSAASAPSISHPIPPPPQYPAYAKSPQPQFSRSPELKISRSPEPNYSRAPEPVLLPKEESKKILPSAASSQTYFQPRKNHRRCATCGGLLISSYESCDICIRKQPTGEHKRLLSPKRQEVQSGLQRVSSHYALGQRAMSPFDQRRRR